VHPLTAVTHLVLAAGLVTTWSAMGQAAGPTSSRSAGADLFVAAIAVWVAVPYVALTLAGRRVGGGAGPRYVLGLAALAITGFVAYLRHQGALTELVFVFLPLWQLVGALPFLALARWRALRA
jgi:hypothetical protein